MKNFRIGLSLLAFMALILGACSSPTEDNPPPKPAPSANLSQVILSDGLTVTGFDPAKDSYEILVSNQSSINITAIPEQGSASLLLNDSTAMVAGMAKSVLLSTGDTTVTVKVLAADNKSTKTYKFLFKRNNGNDTSLTGLTVQDGTVEFKTGQTTLKAFVANGIAKTRVTPSLKDPKATYTMTFGGLTVTSASDLYLAEGDNTLGLEVTAADKTTKQSYSVIINRAGAKSNNAYLKSLVVNGATLNPSFVKTVFDYQASVAAAGVSLTLMAETEHSGATVKLGSLAYTSGTNSGAITPVDGAQIVLTVTAEDGKTVKVYTLTVKVGPVVISELSGLTISQGTLTPSFSKTQKTYTAEVPYETSTMTVTANALAGVGILVNGAAVDSGVASPVIPLNPGANSIEISTLAQSVKNTYNLTVTRKDPVDPVLLNLVPSAGTLGTFDSAKLAYTLNLGTSVTSFTLTPTLKAGTQGTILVAGKEVASGTASEALASSLSTVDVTVKNLAGVVKATYTLTLVKTNGLTIHFQKPAGWSTPSLYYYAVVPATITGPTWAAAPAMTLEGDPANNVYVYTIEGATSATVIFKDASGNQTPGSGQPGFLRTAEGWYVDGKWYDSDPLDRVPPTVNLLAPTTGANLTGKVTLSATAADNKGVAKVEFLLDGKVVASAPVAPYTLTWDSAYFANGSHQLTAKAHDAAGNSTETPAITVNTNNVNLPPVANAGKDVTAQVNLPVTFDASLSTDPNGTIVSYVWDNGLTGVAPTKTYTAMGTYTVKLTVTDDQGATATDTVVITVVEKLPHRDWREERVYFMMTDRFSDGNESNNNIWGDEYLPNGKSQMYDYDESKTGILTYYHGGDFDGIIKNLDYLQDMGFTAVWITPVVKQPEGRRINNDNNYSASAFHGYWAFDFDKIDPHLHAQGKNSDGWADFDKLVAALHARGMKLMLDIVVNHGHPGDSVKGSVSKWAADYNKIIMNGKTWVFDKTVDPLVDPNNAKTGFFSYPGTGGAWLIDLLDFNANGPASNSAMPHLKAVYKRFIDHGVDAFRIDTAAYMSHDNWKDFTDEMYNYAKSLGNDYFYMAGECWTGDRSGLNNAMDIVYGYNAATRNTTFHMLDLHNSSMDFPGWLGNVFKSETSGFDDGNVQKIFGPNGDGSGIYDPTYLSTFVDNHDVFRANGILSQTQYMNNLNYIYLFRGVPIVYYGTEAMYSWPGAIATTNKEDVCARWMLGDVGINYVKTNKPPMYNHLKMLNQIRADFPVIQKGQQTTISMKGNLAVVKRSLGAMNAYVGLNKGAGTSYGLTGLSDGTYTLVTPGTTAGTYAQQSVTVSGGAYTLNVPGNGFAVLIK